MHSPRNGNYSKTILRSTRIQEILSNWNLCCSLPEQSFHAILNLFTCQRNKPKLPFRCEKLTFLLSRVLQFRQRYFQNTFKIKICAFLWNWRYYVCRDAELHLIFWMQHHTTSIAAKLNLQKIVRDFDLKESPWFDDTLKSYQIRQIVSKLDK